MDRLRCCHEQSQIEKNSMRFTITFKDPDGVYDSIRSAAYDSVNDIEGLDDEEKESLVIDRHEVLSDFASKWIGWSEYITIELDTDAKTARVVERK